MKPSIFRVLTMVTAIGTAPLVGCSDHSSGRAELGPGLTDSSGKAVSEADSLAQSAVADLRKGKYEDATVKINKALALRIDRSYYHFLNGLTYHLRAQQGSRADYDMAEQGYGQAIHFDPSNWLAYYFRGRMHIELGQYAEAVRDLAEAMFYRPNDSEIGAAFTFAAYRSGSPDLAAGVLEGMLRSGRQLPASVWRNGAMTMAALGETEKAKQFIERYRAAGGTEKESTYLDSRIDDWSNARAAAQSAVLRSDDKTIAPGLDLVDFGASLPGSIGASISGIAGNSAFPPAASQNGASAFPGLTQDDMKTSQGTEDKMVVIDVVMISTEETIATNRGVNLLNGLNLEFGSTLNGTAVPAFSAVSVSGNGSSSSSTTITRAISLPSVTYTLNILNANNQRSEVLSRPSLVGLAGKQSSFFSGLDLTAAAVAGGSSASTGLTIGGQAINVEKEIGVRLGLIPTVLEDGRLKLAVNIERTFLETPSPDVNFTFKLETSKDQITANVIMRYGETLILGGLSEKETQSARDGVPGLQDVPVLQYLFSDEQRSDYQKSILFLLTPRPPQYIFQPDKARQAYEKTLLEDERPIANLQARYADWFKPYPNWASVFHHLQDNGLYREFRTGDVDLESWSSMQSLDDRLNQALDFLHY